MTKPEWKDADIWIEIKGGPKNTELSAAGESLRVAPEGLTIGRRDVLAPIEVIQNGKTVRSFWISAVVHVNAVAVVAARKIVSGETVTEKDVRESSVETTDTRVVLARNPEEIVGKTARRAFAVGAPLPLDAFSEPLLVRRGDAVSLCLERNGIVLTSPARAVEDGRLGEVIRVKSVDFSSVLRARVTGQAMVSVQ